jgi:hypothetical protein
MRDKLIEVYLDYTNNYLTAEKYADHNGLTVEQAQALLNLAKNVFNTPHPDA